MKDIVRVDRVGFLASPCSMDEGLMPVPTCYYCGQSAGRDHVTLMYLRDSIGGEPDADDLCPDCAAALSTELKRAATQAKERRAAREVQLAEHKVVPRKPKAPKGETW